jgi:hypothetical protein
MRHFVLFALFNYLFFMGMLLYDPDMTLQPPDRWMEAWIVCFLMLLVGNRLFDGGGPRRFA